jgi:hypothetical protein
MSGVQPKTLVEWHAMLVKQGIKDCGLCLVIETKDACSDCAQVLAKQRKFVSFDEHKALVDKLEQFYEWFSGSKTDFGEGYRLAIDVIKGEFQRRFSDFFVVEKNPSHSPPQENREFGSWRNNKSQCGKQLEESGC